jgi:hypothetical protein
MTPRFWAGCVHRTTCDLRDRTISQIPGSAKIPPIAIMIQDAVVSLASQMAIGIHPLALVSQGTIKKSPTRSHPFLDRPTSVSNWPTAAPAAPPIIMHT